MAEEITDVKELNERIAKCYWLADINGASVCKGYCAPCRRIIEKGNCEVVADYFKEKNDAKKASNRESES